MADTPQVEIDPAPLEPFDQEVDSHDQSVIVTTLPAPIPTFKMRGRDDGRTPGSDYIIWIFTGLTPDFAGIGFAGGSPTPIGSLIPGSVVKVVTLGQP